MKNLAIWWAAHIARWAVLYAAFVLQMDGAMYLLKFFIWCLAALAPFMVTDTALRHSAENEEPRSGLRTALYWMQAWTVLLALVWFGHIFTAAAWVLVMLCTAFHWTAVRKMRDAATEPAQPAPT